MRTSSRGYFFLNSSAKDRVDSSLARSTVSRYTFEFPESRTMSCRAASPRVALRHARTTVPPKRARPSAVALPIPEFPPVTRNTRSPMGADMVSRAVDIYDRHATPDKDVHDGQLVGAIWVHVPVDEAGRDVEEVPGTHDRRVRTLRAVLESELTRDQATVEFVGSVMMPTRYRSAVEPRSGHEDIARLVRLLSKDPGCRFAFLQVRPGDDVDPRHGPADERVILKVLLKRHPRRAHRNGPEVPFHRSRLTQIRDFGERAF